MRALQGRSVSERRPRLHACAAPDARARRAGLVFAGASVRAVRALYEWLARLRGHLAALPPGQAPHHNSDAVYNTQLAPFLTGGPSPAGHPFIRLHQLSQARRAAPCSAACSQLPEPVSSSPCLPSALQQYAGWGARRGRPMLACSAAPAAPGCA